MFLVDGALVILHLYAVVAIAFALQMVAVKRLALTAHLACGVLLVIRASVAILISRLGGVVSWLSFSHNSFNSLNSWLKNREPPLRMALQLCAKAIRQ